MSKYKEEAQQLVFKFTVFSYDVNGFKHITELEHEAAKRCAEICIDEKIKILEDYFLEYQLIGSYYIKKIDALNEVKQEINKL
jgi:hypothetical protein